MAKHNFGEKDKEYIGGKECPVWQTPKYEQSKQKAIEMIESEKYGLNDGDFWILVNTYSNGTKAMYSGLIISHNGCLKINDTIENKFKPECFHIEENHYGGLIGVYQDEDTFEIGEVTKDNCSNKYPYAMVLKRTMDRVILKKSKLAFYGVYSDSESEEFTEKFEDTKQETKPQQNKQTKPHKDELVKFCKENNINMNDIAKQYGLNGNCTDEQFEAALQSIKEIEEYNARNSQTR